MKKVIILGAGISGLSLAWFLRKRYSPQEVHITILEEGMRVGGWISSQRQGDFFFEAGPRCLRGDSALPLIRELGLQDELVEADPQAKRKFLAHRGKLLSVPSPLTVLVNPIGRTCLKAMLGYPFRKKMVGEDLSCEDYFSSRFGKDFTSQVIDPMVAGIWGACPKNLSFYASLATMKLRSQKLYTLASGLESLPERIASRLTADIVLGVSPKAIVDHEKNIEVVCDGGSFVGDFLYSSLHPDRLRNLLNKDPLAEALPEVPRTGIALCAVGYRKDCLPQKGFGFLASSLEEAELLGISFDSSLFPQLGKPYATRLSCMFGGERAPHIFSYSDEELKEKAKMMIQRYLGICDAPDVMAVQRAPKSISVYPVHHLRHVQRCELAAAERRICFFGSGLYGVSVPSCIEKSQALATKAIF